jgi:hypothetical protein
VLKTVYVSRKALLNGATPAALYTLRKPVTNVFKTVNAVGDVPCTFPAPGTLTPVER